MWDHTHQQIAHLFATRTLEILEYMRTDTHWRQYGIVIGTPVVELDLTDTDAKGVDMPADRIRLGPDQCAQPLAVLQDNQSVLEKVKEREGADYERAKRGFAQGLVYSGAWPRLTAQAESLDEDSGTGRWAAEGSRIPRLPQDTLRARQLPLDP